MVCGLDNQEIYVVRRRQLWGQKVETGCKILNLHDLFLKGHKKRKQPAVEYKQMQHPTQYVILFLNSSTSLVWTQSVKFYLLKSQ